MLTFFLIPDIRQFSELVHKSCGEVMLHMPDGNRCDLKHSSNARQMLEVMKSRETGVRISLSDHRDVKPFIQYMAEAAL